MTYEAAYHQAQELHKQTGEKIAVYTVRLSGGFGGPYQGQDSFARPLSQPLTDEEMIFGYELRAVVDVAQEALL